MLRLPLKRSARLPRHRGFDRIVLLAAAVVCALSCWHGSVQNRAFAKAAEDPMRDFVVDNATMVALAFAVLSSMVAATENPDVPKGPPDMEKRADYDRVVWVSAFMTLLSGMVNAFAFLEMGFTVAHHTGNATHWGRLYGTDGLKFFQLISSFGLGAIVAGHFKVDGEALFAGRQSRVLLGAAVAVMGGTVIRWMGGPALPACSLWCFSQGMQNSIARKCSSMPLCTTHITGYLTDLGSGLGNWLGEQYRGEPTSSMKKPHIFATSIFAFAVGGFVAKRCRDEWGIISAIGPAVLMAYMAVGASQSRDQEPTPSTGRIEAAIAALQADVKAMRSDQRELLMALRGQQIH